MSDAAVAYEISLLEDLPDHEEAAPAPQDNDDLERLLLAHNPRFQALMAQAQESIKAGKTLSSNELWARVHQKAADCEIDSLRPAAPTVAEKQAEYRVDEE
jgi:hypothetical protein